MPMENISGHMWVVRIANLQCQFFTLRILCEQGHRGPCIPSSVQFVLKSKTCKITIINNIALAWYDQALAHFKSEGNSPKWASNVESVSMS